MLKKIILPCVLSCLLFSAAVNSSAIGVSAESAVLIQCEGEEVVFGKNEHIRMPMASTTKIMTAVIALENSDLSQKVLITDEMIGAEGSSVYLKEGEEILLKDLVYALMLGSANDAAEAIAVHIAGTVEDFAALMNNKAKELGLKDTSFANPHGLDSENHYTTAYDLAKLTVYALKNKEFAKIVSTYKYTVEATEKSPVRYLVNHNKLLKLYDGAIGVKTGFTKKCGRCLVSAAERDGVKLVAVTLSAPDDWNDHIKMLDHGFSLYRSVELAQEGALRFEFPVSCGDSQSFTASNSEGLKLVLKNDSKPVECRIETLTGRYFFAPIEKGTHIADAVFFSDNKEIARIPLYADKDVSVTESRNGFFDLFN